MEHLKDTSIDINTKLFDFSIINNDISYLSNKIIETAEFIYGKNTDVGSSILHYVKKALDFYQSNKDQITTMDYFVSLKKYEDIISPVLNGYFKYTNIVSTEDATLLAYILMF